MYSIYMIYISIICIIHYVYVQYVLYIMYLIYNVYRDIFYVKLCNKRNGGDPASEEEMARAHDRSH